jgi:hypothetical protein
MNNVSFQVCLTMAQVQKHIKRLRDYLTDIQNNDFSARLETTVSFLINGNEYTITNSQELVMTVTKYSTDPDAHILARNDNAEEDPYTEISTGEQ